jgi:hypothetical protein
MVAGLLTDGAGEPLSIQLYAGNTSDPPTFLDAVEQLKVRFGTEEIAVVGDRGMIKALGQAALGGGQFSLRDRADRPASAQTLESRRVAVGFV